MKTEQICVYEFKELNDKIKQKVISKFRNKNDFPFLEDDLNYRWAELLQEYKIETKKDGKEKLFYSLSYCQGDGLCFVGDFVFRGVTFHITHKCRYYHKNSVSIDYEEDEDNEDIKQDIQAQIHREFIEVYNKLCDELEKEGYNIIDNENEEETIIENIKSNDYHFLADGQLWN